jgi:3-oxoacyl-[acyl-carrier protein] reductase
MANQMSRKDENTSGPMRCLVFGGSGTLGSEVCALLHQAGAEVVCTYHRNRQRAEALVHNHPGLRAHPLDLSAAQGIDTAVRDMLAPLGGLDAFIHCAAIGVERKSEEPLQDFPRVEEISVDEWDRVMAINTRSVFLASSAVHQAMAASGGNIVLLGSIDGLKPVPAPLHYAASKGALVAMTRALSKEFAADNIRVNLLVPGVMDGGLSRTLPVKHREEYLKYCSLKRFADPREVARLAVYLALENTYLNGEPIVVDGGL